MKTADQFLSDFLPTASDVKRVMTGQYDGIRGAAKVELLDRDLKPLYLPDPISRRDASLITPVVTACKVDENPTQDVHRTCDLTLQGTMENHLDEKIEQISTLTDLARISAAYYNEKGEEVLSIPVGIFSFFFADRKVNEQGSVWTMKGGDLVSRLTNIWFTNSYTLPWDGVAGGSYEIMPLIRAVLQADKDTPVQGGRPLVGSWPDLVNNPGLTPNGCAYKGPDLPPLRLHITPFDTDAHIVVDPSKLFTPFYWGRNDNVVKSVNDLLQTNNWWPLNVDSFGDFWVTPIPWRVYDDLGRSFVPTDADWNFSSRNNSTLGSGVSIRLGDATAVANVVSVTSKNSMLYRPIHITLENRAPESLVSIENLGYVKMLPPIQDDKIVTVDLLKERAVIELLFAAMATESCDVTSILNPFFEHHDIVGIDVWRRDGKQMISSSSPFYPFVVSNWTMDFKEWTTSFTAGRLIPLKFTEVV